MPITVESGMNEPGMTESETPRPDNEKQNEVEAQLMSYIDDDTYDQAYMQARNETNDLPGDSSELMAKQNAEIMVRNADIDLSYATANPVRIYQHLRGVVDGVSDQRLFAAILFRLGEIESLNKLFAAFPPAFGDAHIEETVSDAETEYGKAA